MAVKILALAGTPLDVDAAAIERRLEALPWVDTATVDRSWTGRVTIEVTERVAVAAVMREQNAWVLVDASGRVLTGIVAVAPDIPKISGVSAAGEPGTRLFADADAPLQVAAMLPPSLEGEVDGIYLDELGELWVSLKTADRVIFGDHRDLALKVVAMTEVLADLREKGRVAFEIDVSVPTLSVVRDLRASLRPAQTAAAVEGSAPAGAASPGA